MDSSPHINSARKLLAVTWGLLCVMILAAPILLSHSCCKTASVLYLSFSFICHQIPERSFMISGHSFAVCHRCFGIYLGLFLGSLIENRFIHRSQQARRFYVLASIIPMLLDAVLPFTGLWSSTGISRFFTGLLFGSLISYLLVCGVAEILNEAPWRRFVVDDLHLKEGLS
jgi:uncharacterized membrane protein